jgi:hypothetical protein
LRIFVYLRAGKHGCVKIEGGEMLFKKGVGGFSARSIEGFHAKQHGGSAFGGKA